MSGYYYKNNSHYECFCFFNDIKKIIYSKPSWKTYYSCKKSRFPIFWAVTITIWCIVGYYHYRKSPYHFLLDIVWIEISIYSIINDLHSSEIRKNGFYESGKFYKWSKVQNYSWILPTTIQFEVNTFFKTNYSFKFTIKEELKSKVNETVQKVVHS